MSAVPAGLATDQQPPMTVPVRYFLVGFLFLLAGGAVGLANVVGAAPGLARLAHVHLLLAGRVCLTIMGAMTQFVPVWSNVPVHSRRLANAALAAGFVVFTVNLVSVVYRHGRVLPERFHGRPENAG